MTRARGSSGGIAIWDLCKTKPIYGLLAEFETPEQVLAAAQRTHDAGYKSIDAFSPIPVHGLAEAVGFDWTSLPIVVFIGGLCGGLTRLRHVLLRQRGQLSAEYRRQAAQ